MFLHGEWQALLPNGVDESGRVVSREIESTREDGAPPGAHVSATRAKFLPRGLAVEGGGQQLLWAETAFLRTP